MAPGGIESVRIGICTGGITTIITCTDATNGDGADSAASVCTSTDCEPCIETTKGTGAVCALTGTCGVVTTTTSDLVGSGLTAIGRLVGTGTDCVCTGGGPEAIGTMCEAIGICTGAIITTTISTAATSGCGVDTGALVCTGTVCAHCTEITKDIGVVFVPTGICGVGIITTSARDGSGDGSDVLHVISTASEFCGAGTAHGGIM